MDDDQILNSISGGPVATAGASAVDDDGILDSVAAVTSQTAKGAGTPDNPLKAVITFSQKIQEARQVGQMGFRESALGHAVKDGRMTLEDAEKQIAADDTLAQLSGDIEAYEKQAWNSWITGIPTSVALSTAKQLPMLEASLTPLAAGAVLGGGAAAATGVGAAFAVPVGSMTGTTAAAGWAADLITGQEYLDLRRKGMDHNAAVAASSISGILQGSLQGLQLGQSAKVATTAAQNVLKAHAQSMARFFSEGVKFGGIQLALSEAQTAAKLITDAIAGTVAKAPGAVPTLEQASKEFADTFRETLNSSIGLFLGGKAIGKAGGLAWKTGKDVVNSVRGVHDAHMAKQKAKVEKALAADEAPAEPADTESQAVAEETKEPSKSAQDKERQAKQRLEKRVAAENEIKRIFTAAASKYFIETPETRLQEVNRVQRLLKRMVTNSDKLDDKMKSRLLARIVEIDGVKDLLKRGERFIEDQRGREYANQLKDAQDRLKAAIKSGQHKGKKAALPMAEQASMKWFQEFFSEPKREKGQTAEDARQVALQRATDFVERGIEDERKELDEQIEKLENNQLSEMFNQPAALAEKRRVAMLAQQFWSGGLDADGINKLAGEIEETVKSGKSEFVDRKRLESQRLLSARAEIMEGVQGSKPVTPSVADSAPKELTGIGKLMNSLRRTSTSLWDKLLQDTPSEERQKLVSRILDFTDSENKESAINIRAAEKLSDLYTNAAGTIREVNKLVRDGSKNQKFEDRFTDANGQTQILGRHTLNELVYLHMAMDDPGAIPGLVNGNKYTLEGMVEIGQTSTQEVVRRILQEREGGRYLKLADSIKDFYRWFAPQIANHYLKEYGVVLPMDPNYSGQIFHRQLERIKSAGDLINDVHQQAQRSLSPGSTKARSNSKLPIKLVDPFAQVQRHRSEMAFWMANSEQARRLSFIFSDSTKDGLRDVIQHKLGREFTSLIDSRIAYQYHLKPGIMDIGDRTIQNWKNNLATGLLGARLDQAPKQWLSVLGALSTNSYAEFADGLRGAMDKKRLQEYLSKSDLYKDRQNDLLPQILEATKERSYVDSVSGDRALALKQFFLIPMSNWGDGVASALTGFIEYNRVRKAGGTVEEAVLAGDALVDRTQSSSRASQKVPAEFKGGISNLSLAFAKQNIQMLNLESGALRDWFIHKDAKSAARLARTVAAIHVTQALFQSINSLPAWVVGDEKEQEQAALKIASAFIGGSFTQLPLLGVDVVYGALSGWEGKQEPRTIIGGLTGDSVKLLKRVYKIVAESEDVEGEDWIHALDSLASVGSILTGIPFWGLWQYTKLSSRAAEKAQSGD